MGRDCKPVNKKKIIKAIKGFNVNIHVLDYEFEGSNVNYDLKLYCVECNHEWVTNWTKFNRKYNRCCENCGRENVNRVVDMYPEIIPLLVNDKDKYLAPTSRKYVSVKCDICSNIRDTKMCVFTKKPYSCPSCSGSYSFPERFLFNILKELGCDFVKEKMFEGVKYRYDFLLNHNNTTYTIETHGEQHYKINNFKSGTAEGLEKQIKTDIIKRELSEGMGNVHIEIDCSSTHLQHLKREIIKELGNILYLDTIDWNKIYMDSSKTCYRDAIEMYTGGQTNMTKIAKELNTSIATISRYVSKYKATLEEFDGKN